MCSCFFSCSYKFRFQSTDRMNVVIEIENDVIIQEPQ